MIKLIVFTKTPLLIVVSEVVKLDEIQWIRVTSKNELYNTDTVIVTAQGVPKQSQKCQSPNNITTKSVDAQT